MAGRSKKKRAVEEEMRKLESRASSDSSSDEDDAIENEAIEDEVQVDFEARNPEDSDFHGMRMLLQQLFQKEQINISELTDRLISQNYIGSVIKQAGYSDDGDTDESEDDDDNGQGVFGLISAVNLTKQKDLECVKQIKKLVLDKCAACEGKKERDKLAEILDHQNKHVGLLLNERFINIPAQIALPSFESLMNEIDRAKKKMNYNFEYYLMFSKTYKLAERKKSVKGKRKDKANEKLVFTNEEEQFFFEEADLSFTYEVAKDHDTAVAGEWGDEETELEPLRTVIIFQASKMPIIINKLAEALSVAT